MYLISICASLLLSISHRERNREVSSVFVAVADEGRAAVNEGGGMAALLSLLQRYISSTEDGAGKLRVIACGFILNLTNECGESMTSNFIV